MSGSLTEACGLKPGAETAAETRADGLGEKGTLTASGGRRLSYLRLSVTDLCNLRCRYCMPSQGLVKLRHEDILSYEELLRLAAVGASLGLKKLRLTGGEPLIRKGLLDFIARLGRYFSDIRLTTNGLLLAPLAAQLKQLGVSGLNLSLDALDPDIYARVSGLPLQEGRRAAEAAWRGFEAALAQGFKTKINCVPLRGLNDTELLPLARLALHYPVEVRFIEHMPVGGGELWDPALFMSSAELMELFRCQLGPLSPAAHQDPSAPARLYRFPGAKGALGFISAVSRHFCADCNRLRLTADGRLIACLLSGSEIDVRGPLRQGADDGQLAALFERAAAAKPSCYQGACSGPGPARPMSRIGG